jgi:hypothetical protein
MLTRRSFLRAVGLGAASAAVPSVLMPDEPDIVVVPDRKDWYGSIESVSYPMWRAQQPGLGGVHALIKARYDEFIQLLPERESIAEHHIRAHVFPTPGTPFAAFWVSVGKNRASFMTTTGREPGFEDA